jgi:ferredoxin
MSTHITDDCISCAACVSECPNGAISEGEGIYVIDSNSCTECVGFNDSEACQEVCPTECCVPDPEHPETEAHLVEKALRLHAGAELQAKFASGKFPSRFRA